MRLYIFVLGGFVIAKIFDFGVVYSQKWYMLLISTLLAVGLYGSTFGISVKEARKHLKLICTAVTVGVVLKALIIGAIASLVLGNPFGFVLGVAVAQIDPLSTAALLKGKRLSTRAKTILAAWSSFDDPVTVILALYVPAVVAMLLGLDWQAVGSAAQQGGFLGYVKDISLNLLFVGGVFTFWGLIKRYAKHKNYVVIMFVALAMYLLVIAALSTAIYYFWMIGVALIGLFMRPPLQDLVERAVDWSLAMAALLLGIILVNGANLWVGIILGLSAFGAQVLVGFLLTRKLPRRDQTHIAFAQQNGITAIVLALLFEPFFPGMIAIIAPAILTINTVHTVANRIIDLKVTKPEEWLLGIFLEKIKIHLEKI